MAGISKCRNAVCVICTPYMYAYSMHYMYIYAQIVTWQAYQSANLRSFRKRDLSYGKRDLSHQSANLRSLLVCIEVLCALSCSPCVCMYIHINMFVCMHVCIYTYICYVYMYIYVHICIYMLYIHVCICI